MTMKDITPVTGVATNKLTKEMVSVTLESGSVLTADTVRNYLVSGSGSANITDQEVMMFLEMCKAQKLNPFIGEAYLVKYGNQAAQRITGKDVFIKRAAESPIFDGMRAGIVVVNRKGELEYREGSLKLPNEQIIGGWCEVYLKDKKYPAKAVVSFEEYAGRKANGEINSMWSSKPGTMIRKVAQSQALREAFPNELRGLYQAEEMGTTEYEAPTKEIPLEVIERKETVAKHPTEETEIIDVEIIEDRKMSTAKKKIVQKVAAERGLYDLKKPKEFEFLKEYLEMYQIDLENMKESQFDEVIAVLKQNKTNGDTSKKEIEINEQPKPNEEKVTMAREIIENYNKANGIPN